MTSSGRTCAHHATLQKILNPPSRLILLACCLLFSLFQQSAAMVRYSTQVDNFPIVRQSTMQKLSNEITVNVVSMCDQRNIELKCIIFRIVVYIVIKQLKVTEQLRLFIKKYFFVFTKNNIKLLMILIFGDCLSICYLNKEYHVMFVTVNQMYYLLSFILYLKSGLVYFPSTYMYALF